MTGEVLSTWSDCSDVLSPCSDWLSVVLEAALITSAARVVLERRAAVLERTAAVLERTAAVLERTAAVLGVIGAAVPGASGNRFVKELVAPGRLGIKRAIAGGGDCFEVEGCWLAATKPMPAVATAPTAAVAASLWGHSPGAAAVANRPSLAARSIA